MKSDLESYEISPSEWLPLNRFLHEIKQINATCVSVYYQYGKGPETISLLQETKRVESIEIIELKIEKRIAELRENPVSVGKFTKTLCVFGWMKNDKVNIKEIGTSKKLPYIYMVSKKPYTKPFDDILKTEHNILLVTLDQKSAKIQKFHGSQIVQESKLRIYLQGRHRAGGQSQGRFLRARQTKIHVFFKKVANKVKEMNSNSELILLGGIGQAKTEFYGELDSELVKKCRFVENLSFSTSINDIDKKIIHHLYQYRRKYVAEIIEKYEKLVKERLTAKRNDVIYKALEVGAVDMLIVFGVITILFETVILSEIIWIDIIPFSEDVSLAIMLALMSGTIIVLMSIFMLIRPSKTKILGAVVFFFSIAACFGMGIFTIGGIIGITGGFFAMMDGGKK